MQRIKLYHAHLYYNKPNLDEARELRKVIGEKFEVELGRLHEKPVGPHPIWSCQITIPVKRFGEVVPWLALHRGSIDFFIHPVTGNDLDDHTKFVMWLGKSYQLNLEGW